MIDLGSWVCSSLGRLVRSFGLIDAHEFPILEHLSFVYQIAGKGICVIVTESEF